MKKKVTVTLDKKDRECLVHAAMILKTISNSSRCWTTEGIYRFLNEDDRQNVDVDIVWEKGDEENK